MILSAAFLKVNNVAIDKNGCIIFERGDMSKRIIIVGIIILILVGGGLFVVNKQSRNIEEAKMTADKSASRYVEYSKEIFDQAVNNRRVLFFYASWCPICRPADADFKQNSSKIPKDVTVLRVNYNDPDTDQEEKDLAKKYGITYQHTFVQIDAQGKELTKWTGGQTDELLNKIK